MATQLTGVKELADSASSLSSIPSSYVFKSASNCDIDPLLSDSIPVVDLSLLTSSDPDQRSTAIHQLGNACREWGFFMVVNHGVPKEKMKEMMDWVEGFFNLSVEEKQELKAIHVMDPVQAGTSVNVAIGNMYLWRDFLKVAVHPQFHFPHKPQGFSEVGREYCGRVREIARVLLGGISESLGLEEDYLEKLVNWKSGHQLFAANLYPPCPSPEAAMGIPWHTDYGLLTLLAQNDVNGLQIQYKDKYVPVSPIPASFLVNTGDQLEIISNGKYKSNFHRAVVNDKATRISLAMPHGPSLDTVVGPAPHLVNNTDDPPGYNLMKYGDYMELKQTKPLINGKSCLEHIRIE